MHDDEMLYKRAPNPRDDASLPPVEVPSNVLTEEALTGLVEAFVLREGTDYGANEVAHETKINQVRKQLERGDIRIVFDPNSQSVTLLTQQEWRKLNQSTKG